MKGKFIKLKLLCFLLISFFIFGFGGEVKAEVFYSKGTLNYRGLTYFQWFYPSYNSNVDAYCINSSFNAPTGLSMTYAGDSLIPSSKRDSIINILKESQNLNLTAGQRYYVTQAAIWYTLNGLGTNGITPGFYSWISTNYSTSWNRLINASKNKIVEPNIAIKGTNYTLEASDNGMVSQDFYVQATGVSGSFNVKIDNGSTGACILYNGNCTSSITVAAGTRFKVKVDTPSESAEVNAKFTVTPVNNPNVSRLATYGGLNSQGYQNIVVLTNLPKTLSKSQTLKGNFVGDRTIQVQKVDKDTCTLDGNGNVTDFNTCTKVAGAEFYIKDENDAKIKTVISTGPGEANPQVSLPIGNYTMVENAAPNGYYSNDDAVSFSVESDGVHDSNGNLMTDSVPTIYYSNSKVRIKFRKLDKNNQPMEGVKFIIMDQLGSEAGDNYSLCAITDSNGYLTQECSGSDKTNNVNSNGEYTLGLDFGRTDGSYRIQEICETDSCRQYEPSRIFTGDTIDFMAFDNGRTIDLFNSNLSLEEQGNSATPLIIMNMKNENSIKIGKTDVTSGAEIAGARLVVTDPSIVPEKVTEHNCILSDGTVVDSCEVTRNDNVIDSWTSSDLESHKIVGIVPGHKYRLTEELAPEGYVKMDTSIDFIMDENGNVTTYDVETGEPITDLTGTNYELLITNDYTKVTISKADMVTGEEIPGARIKMCTAENYTLDGNDCDPFAEWISGDQPHEIDRLKTGEYCLIETIAPTGYAQKTSGVCFSVDEKEEIQAQVLENKPIKVVIKKIDQITKQPVEGAQLQILNASDRSIAKTNTGAELKWTSKKDEVWDISGIPVGDYILVETITPDGYQEGMVIDDVVLQEFAFTITGKEDVDIELYLEVMNAPNTGISTLNLFAIGGLMIFVGYETIKIYKRKALD